MTERFFGNSLWYLVKQSDVVTKIVLLIVLVMSIVCWAIFLYKIIMFRIKRKQLQDLHEQLKRVSSLEGLITLANKFNKSFAGYLLSNALLSFKNMVKRQDGGQIALLSKSEYESLCLAIDSTAAELVYQQESYLPFLSVSAAVSPLLGLFGTVWGLVHAFVRIGELQTADIATVAPGIAEALITTLAGLMVAIPALVLYHICANHVKELEMYVFKCADQIMLIMRALSVKE